jgi:hypothetical protein
MTAPPSYWTIIRNDPPSYWAATHDKAEGNCQPQNSPPNNVYRVTTIPLTISQTSIDNIVDLRTIERNMRLYSRLMAFMIALSYLFGLIIEYSLLPHTKYNTVTFIQDFWTVQLIASVLFMILCCSSEWAALVNLHWCFVGCIIILISHSVIIGYTIFLCVSML